MPEWTSEVYRLLDVGDRGGAVSHYMKDIPLEVLDGLRDSPLWEPLVAHAESLRADVQALEEATSAPHPELFSGLNVPALLVVGRETFDEMPAAAASLAAALPHATRAEVAGAQHTREPAAMADLLTGFPRDLSGVR